jgi:chromosome segregation ATPase
MVDRYSCPPMSDQKPEADGCMVYYAEYAELARRVDTMERDRHSAESENKTLRDRVKALTAERDDYILKQKVWEGANEELRSESIRLNRKIAQLCSPTSGGAVE